ncbi:MAG: four-helix bundle copper-binding protein [Pseudorhodoplanes sp.]|uniref:four-helix bundle copper-binding protein n=1 Tax=Pseudorhodoplanes sp. TaxID=1934341 RepID=UPI003D09646E
MSAVAVRTMFRSHPERPSNADAISHCIEACFACVETCTACADACLAEKGVASLIVCIRLNHDCAAVCAATGSILSRANKVGHRQLLEAQLTTCIAFARTCAAECQRHADMHKHCEICAKACQHCVESCTEMLTSMRMPA